MKKRTRREDDIDAELIAKGKAAADDFDASAAVSISPIPTPNKMIAIRLPTRMIHQLKQTAAQKGFLGYQQLIKAYIAAGLANEPKPGSSTFNLSYAWVAEPSATTGSPAREFWESKVAEHLPLEESGCEIPPDK
jgi:predicted DNA binding CopG/RHH family protein